MENIKSGIKLNQLKNFIHKNLSEFDKLKKVLVIHPDYTRIDFTNKLVPIILRELENKGALKIDFLNAGGTHRKMTRDEFDEKLGIIKKQGLINYFNHEFDDEDSLIKVGEIPSGYVNEKTKGQLNQAIPVTINKLLLADYDIIIAICGTVPHESAGFSGGLKIFFPGVSGPNVINLFHWAAVLVGIPEIIGTVENVARDIINMGSSFIFKKINSVVVSFNMVSTEIGNDILPVGLFYGTGQNGLLEAYIKAAKLSSKVHIKYIDKPIKQVVQVIPACYDEIWLAGKGSYKLQKPGVMVENGEIILFAPHIHKLHSNKSMNKELLKAGYHCKDFIIEYLRENPDFSRNSAAHLINVAGPGVFDKKRNTEKLKLKITLATAIPEKVCRALGLGYRDPASIKKEDFIDPGKLWIEEGGKYLYDLKKNKGGNNEKRDYSSIRRSNNSNK